MEYWLPIAISLAITAVIAAYSVGTFVSNRRFRKWTESLRDPTPILIFDGIIFEHLHLIVGEKVYNEIPPHDADQKMANWGFIVILELSNPGDTPIHEGGEVTIRDRKSNKQATVNYFEMLDLIESAEHLSTIPPRDKAEIRFKAVLWKKTGEEFKDFDFSEGIDLTFAYVSGSGAREATFEALSCTNMLLHKGEKG